MGLLPNRKANYGGERRRVNKTEKVFWVLLIIIALVMVMFVFLVSADPPRHTRKCNDGTSTQVQDGVVYKTYIPELNECKK